MLLKKKRVCMRVRMFEEKERKEKRGRKTTLIEYIQCASYTLSVHVLLL